MAWLHATPKPDPRTRRGKADQAPPRLSRLAELKRQKIAVQMPANPMPHIIDRLVEIGLSEAAGIGAAPLSWREIDAWCSRTGVDLDPWEGRLIRKLSAAYLAEGRTAESENCPPPWRVEVTAREREVETAGLRALLG